MASVLDQLPQSTLSLVGNGFNAQPNQPAWGYESPLRTLDPKLSQLQDTYSVDGNPNVRLIDFNKDNNLTVRPPARLDELDPNAPNNTEAGKGGVVSQIYKSATGRKYKDLGPQPGRY